MAQLSKVFFPYDPLPAQDLNDMVGFMNGVADGTNLEDEAVTARTLAQSVGGWQNWTPTWANVTIGNGDVVARYAEVGKIVRFWLRFQLGSTSSVSGFIGFTLPVQARDSGMDGSNSLIGQASYRDDSPSTLHLGAVRFSDSTSVSLLRIQPSAFAWAGTSSTAPFTWATNDVIWAEGTYEAA